MSIILCLLVFPFKGDIPACSSLILDASINVYPSDQFSPGRDPLTITVSFQSTLAYSFTVYRNGEPMNDQDHNARIYSQNGQGCWKSASITWQSPGPSDAAFYEIRISGMDNDVTLNTTVTALRKFVCVSCQNVKTIFLPCSNAAVHIVFNRLPVLEMLALSLCFSFRRQSTALL